MIPYILFRLELLLRLVVAGACGSLIGYERKNRLKEAGLRTHMIVALGAALIMIVSKYGFADVLGLKSITLDPSRIAAQVVSGIGFLGAGIIFIRKQTISGLTTAAGIWATAGVGMAIGAKMYFVGISATLLVLAVQIIFHKDFRWLHLPVSEQIDLVFDDSESNAVEYIRGIFETEHIGILNFRIEHTGERQVELELHVRLPQKYDVAKLMDLFRYNSHIRSVEY